MTCNVGDTICNCTLLQKCGNGAYGEVWLAMDAIGANVALKIIKNGGRYSERELTGLKNYKDCNHPNLLKIRYVEITDEQIICIMDAADDLNHGNGEYQPDTLANRLRKYGRLDGKEISAMLDGLLSGLEELHKQGLVHRDIKPDNILWVNGRATLADVGLIAFEGAGSLVGTPGFLSPRVLEGNPAEASDDFYALGKVIYCALTGLAVTEYPSLPADVTISMDANLNRALRESCKNSIRSSDEFRKLLAQRSKDKQPTHANIKVIFTVCGILVIACILLYTLYNKENTSELNRGNESSQAPAVLPPVAGRVTPEAKDTQLQKLETLNEDAMNDLQNKVQAKIKELGFFSDNGKLLSLLLTYQVVSGESIRELVLSGRGNPRIRMTAVNMRTTTKTPTVTEQRLFSLLMDYAPDLSVQTVRSRQRYWQNQPGTPAEKQNRMLTSDPVMQALALDAVIRSGINSILRNNQLTEDNKNGLQSLMRLRYYLLTPEMYKLDYLRRTSKD